MNIYAAQFYTSCYIALYTLRCTLKHKESRLCHMEYRAQSTKIGLDRIFQRETTQETRSRTVTVSSRDLAFKYSVSLSFSRDFLCFLMVFLRAVFVGKWQYCFLYF